MRQIVLLTVGCYVDGIGKDSVGEMGEGGGKEESTRKTRGNSASHLRRQPVVSGTTTPRWH